jgi:uncharacterized membrane protein
MSLLPDPLHPAIVHFPIALSVVALLFELIARHPRARSMGTAAGVLLVLAAIGSVVAVLTGNAAHDEAVVPAAVAPLVAQHQQVGEIAMWLLLAVAVVRIALAWRGWLRGWLGWGFLLALAGVTGLVGFNGYLGGRMVFDHGLGTVPVQRQGARAPAPPSTTGLPATVPK